MWQCVLVLFINPANHALGPKNSPTLGIIGNRCPWATCYQGAKQQECLRLANTTRMNHFLAGDNHKEQSINSQAKTNTDIFATSPRSQRFLVAKRSRIGCKLYVRRTLCVSNPHIHYIHDIRSNEIECIF